MRTLIIALLIVTATSLSMVWQSNGAAFTAQEWPFVTLRGRHPQNGQRPALYRVRMPQGWRLDGGDSHSDLSDSTMPIARFTRDEGEGTLVVTVHNFPNYGGRPPIPPDQQVERWLTQLSQDGLKPPHNITEVNFSGYIGFKVEADGPLHSLMAWSLAVAEEHQHALLAHADGPYRSLMQERVGPVTIKATGPRALLRRLRAEVETLAESFEQLEEMPASP